MSLSPRLRFVLLLLLLLGLPLAIWLAFKPLRILLPSWNGVRCERAVCVERPADRALAQRLHADAMAAVADKLVALREPPLTVFCATRDCYRRFGGGAERGATIFDLGVILPPESWVAHIVEHEFVHMLQAQELGLRGRERTPLWFKEGMPFLISAPPEHDLPAYARPWVAEYAAWERRVGRAQVWRAIAAAR